jgi:hypothetical protein
MLLIVMTGPFIYCLQCNPKKLKQVSLILIFVIGYTATCFSQDGGISVGVDVVYHLEARTRTLETMLHDGEERHSLTDFFGAGVVLQKKFSNSWGFNTGIDYVQRQYNARVYFDQCFKGGVCEYILRTVGDYRYKTIEIPLGVSRYLSTGERWEFYINLTLRTAIDFESYYGSKKLILDETHLFSGSLVQSIGLMNNINEKLKFSFEPFIRLVNVQRDDPILILSSAKKWTFLDNIGMKILFLYRIQA